MNIKENARPINILMVEDNPMDVRLTLEAFKESKILNDMTVLGDGEEAMKFLHREGKYTDARRPDLILLDLNLPKMDGIEVLAEIKTDENLKCIPVVVMTTSKSEEDVIKSYDHHANCFITKPVSLDGFTTVIQSIDNFWLTIVTLPSE